MDERRNAVLKIKRTNYLIPRNCRQLVYLALPPAMGRTIDEDKFFWKRRNDTQ